MKIFILFFSCFFCFSALQTKTLLIQTESLSFFEDSLQSHLEKWTVISLPQHKLKSNQIEKASLINRLNPDLFIMIKIIISYEKTPSCSLYSFAWNATDKWPKQIEPLEFTPFFKAHYKNAKDSHDCCYNLHEHLKNKLSSFAIFSCQFPFKPLEGITCPAFAIELILNSKETWAEIELLMVESIKKIVSAQ